ncbi:MAG: 3-hydroxyacyl-ACP dehydratase FabZ [Terriglobia bacterium]
MLMDVNEIQRIIPHRYPFLLVDSILELEPARRIVGIKNVSINEPFFQGHFPGTPVMPGVLIVEAMAQVAAVMVLKELPDREHKLVYFSGIDHARFRHPVVPGDQIRIVVEVIKMRQRHGKLKAEAFVLEKLVAEAEIFSTIVDRSN